MIFTVPNAGMPPHKSAPLPVSPVTSAVRVRALSARGRILADAFAQRAPGWDFVEDRAAADDGFRQQIRSQAGRFAEEQRASRLHGPTERLRGVGAMRAHGRPKVGANPVAKCLRKLANKEQARLTEFGDDQKNQAITM